MHIYTHIKIACMSKRANVQLTASWSNDTPRPPGATITTSTPMAAATYTFVYAYMYVCMYLRCHHDVYTDGCGNLHVCICIYVCICVCMYLNVCCSFQAHTHTTER